MATLVPSDESSIEELRAFHDAIVPRLKELIDFLNTFPVQEIPQQYRPLSYAVLAALATDDAVHIWRRPTLTRSPVPRTHSPEVTTPSRDRCEIPSA